MARKHAHFRSAHAAVQIRRKQLPDLSALHGVTSTLPPRHEPAFALWMLLFRLASLVSAGASSPNSGPTSPTYLVRILRIASRPRVIRDLTVPKEMAKTSAISSYDISSRSRRIKAVRYGSGTCCRYSSTAAWTSEWANCSNGDSPGSTSRSSPENPQLPAEMGSIGVSCAL